VSPRRKPKRAMHPNSLANLRRGGTPPRAPIGNTRALRHGGRAEVSVPGLDAARRAIYERLSASAPVRDADGELPAADEGTVELAARALARVRSVDAWLAAHGYIDERTGDVKKAAEYVESASRTADGLLAKLGMNPRDRASLGLDLARGADLATALSEEDADRRSELLHRAGLTEDDE
jgi:hypothetical protein